LEGVTREVDGDACEVRSDFSVATKARKSAEKSDERFLTHIVGVVAWAEHRGDGARDGRLMAGDERAERELVAARGAGHQREIVNVVDHLSLVPIVQAVRSIEYWTVRAAVSFHGMRCASSPSNGQ